MVKSTNLAIPGHFVKGHNLMHCILLLEHDDVQYMPAVPVWGFLSLTTSLLLMLQLTGGSLLGETLKLLFAVGRTQEY